MVHLIGLLLTIFIGCQPNEGAIPLSRIASSEGQEKTVVGKNSTTESIDNGKKDQDMNIRRVKFGGKNWIDFAVIQTSANIKDYIYEFERVATMDFSLDSGEEIKSKKELQYFCHKNSYEKNRNLDGLIGNIGLFINPLSWHISRMIAGFFLRETVTEVENPFVISKKQVMIEADFLDQSEKRLVIENGVFDKFDELDFLRVNLFHPWGRPSKQISSVIMRLFCGIADDKASISYVFNNDKGETLRVKINDVNFKLLNY